MSTIKFGFELGVAAFVGFATFNVLAGITRGLLKKIGGNGKTYHTVKSFTKEKTDEQR